jgi:hypothetical protein
MDYITVFYTLWEDDSMKRIVLAIMILALIGVVNTNA